MAELNDWDVAAPNNNSAPPDGAPEGWLASSVNNWARETMAVVARYYQDNNGTLVTTGTTSAFVIASPNGTYTSYFTGLSFKFRPHLDNISGGTTLAISGLAAQSVLRPDGSTLRAGDLQQNGVAEVVYNETLTAFILMSPAGTPGALEVAGQLATNLSTAVDLTDADAPLRVSNAAGLHLEGGQNQLQAKANATTAAELRLNPRGGDVAVGAIGTSGSVSLTNGSTDVRGSDNFPLRLRNNGDSNPALGQNQNVAIQFRRADNTILGRVGFSASPGLALVNQNHGGRLFISGEDSTGALHNCIEANPDGDVQLYHDNSVMVRTLDATQSVNLTGLQVRDNTGSGTFRPVALGTMTFQVRLSDFSITKPDALRVNRITVANVDVTLATGDTDPPIGSYGWIINDSTGTIRIVPGIGTSIFARTAIASFGTVRIQDHGSCMWWKETSNRYWILNGNGVID